MEPINVPLHLIVPPQSPFVIQPLFDASLVSKIPSVLQSIQKNHTVEVRVFVYQLNVQHMPIAPQLLPFAQVALNVKSVLFILNAKL